MGNRQKKEHEEEGAGEAWLLPYSDLMTLLLAVFIVLFAVSKQDTVKTSQMAQAFQGMFQSGSGMLNQGDAIIDGGNPINIRPTISPFEPSDQQLSQQQISQQKEQQMKEMEDTFKTYILENDLSDSIHTALVGNEITVTLASDILFPLGSAELTAEQKERAQVIAGIILDMQDGGYPIVVKVSGHTDNLPIRTSKYPSNWELSLDRAVNFMAAMVESSGLDPRIFTAAGYGELDPVDTNDTEKGRSYNRRVEIRISYQSSTE